MVEGGISQLSGDPAGYAILDLDIRTERTGLSTLFSIVNIGLLGIPMVLGLPKEQVRVECIAIVKLLNKEETYIGTYMGSSRLKGLNSLYVQNRRKWTREVFSKAMRDIQRQVHADYSSLKEQFY